MSIHSFVGLGMFVVLSGCGSRQSAASQGKGNGSPPPPPLAVCPDPPCEEPNGTGIYTAGNGRAAIGPHQLMITHFVNQPSPVAGESKVLFEGRYFDDVIVQGWDVMPRAGGLVPGPGTVSEADYRGTTMGVAAVSESDTALRWTLFDRHTLETVQATDDVTIYLSMTVATPGTTGHTETYALSFKSRPTPPPHNPIAVDKRPPHAYDLTWIAVVGAPVTTPAPYCLDAQGNADSVVFQQGLAIEPVNGRVTRDTTTTGVVTMSCWLGAPATVYSWGYGYGAASGTALADTFYFDAAIQMKRASYCADAQYFTIAGTQIAISDDKHIQPAPVVPGRVEAWWAPTGAVCLNTANMRHHAMGFTGTCGGQPIPACPPTIPASPFLIDAPANPGP